ncbi:MAG: 4Fe-4S binding protein [Methanocorpusculum sp.]|uniref:4Fe-4S binding protein n=1 Tax=Methanocorpusculum sp. TaxID=2058474 RepID=UPI00272193BF|nr:4Fe-4S binding protein [Methanocorpusculum sp.]MDO9523109.1 4Fe-4S binding protein [Methanocorpusculum sp.]
MKNKLRKSLMMIGGTAFLAAPACAAVCPRGHSECPYPGKCFLYVDADGNSLCDYTSTDSGSTVSTTDASAISENSVQVASGSQTDSVGDIVSSAVSTESITTSSADSGLSPLVFSAAGLLIGGALILFLYFAMKYLRKEKPEAYGKIFFYAGFVPVLLGILIILNDPESFGFTGTLADIAASYSGIMYMFGGTLLMAALWMRKILSKAALISVLLLTSAAGFLLVVPITPDGFYVTVSSISTLSFAGLGFAGLLALIIISVIFGRVFCAHMCPAGALQELLSRIPVKKLQINNRKIPNTIRALVFVALLTGAVFSYNIFEYVGISSFFALMFTTAAFVFAMILLVSVFVYRPFCTFLCPYGFVLSLFARFGRFGLKRTNTCINCRKCERICPTKEAGRKDTKAECYLCGRCIEVCPVESAIVYGKRTHKREK